MEARRIRVVSPDSIYFRGEFPILQIIIMDNGTGVYAATPNGNRYFYGAEYEIMEGSAVPPT